MGFESSLARLRFRGHQCVFDNFADRFVVFLVRCEVAPAESRWTTQRSSPGACNRLRISRRSSSFMLQTGTDMKLHDGSPFNDPNASGESRVHSSAGESMPVSLARVIDPICDQFEAGMEDGRAAGH